MARKKRSYKKEKKEDWRENIYQDLQDDTGLRYRGKDRPVSQLSENEDSMNSDLSMYQQNYQGDTASTSSLAQQPPQNRSGDCPSGGFFAGSSGIDIKGGKFSQTYGHHTNVTIHVNQPREDACDMPQQYSFPASLSSPLSTLNHNITLPPPQDVQTRREQLPAMSLYEQGSSTSIHSIASTSTLDIHHGQFPPNSRYEQGHSTSTIIYSPDNSNKIYERHLELKRRGFPLWIPEPNRTLPMPYRRKGVNIGDVGIITSSGGFSFLFNICLPPDDPINPPVLPDGFVPIHPPIKPMDIREYSEFNPESYLASEAIEKIQTEPEFRGLSFATSAAEGAVLTLPEGATAHDLANIRRFRAYAAANIESWYRYVNGTRGWEVQNGEVRLVIGCDKATSWGMAAVANMTQHKTHHLNYRSIGDGEEDTSPIPLYKWEYTGLAETRVGPGLQDIADLKRNDDSDVAVDGKYWNQCLFIRTLNLRLSDAIFAAIEQELEAALIQETQQHRDRRDRSSLTKNSPNTGTETGSAGQQLDTGLTTRTLSISESLGSDMENLAIGVEKGHVTTSQSPSAPKSHPADVLNHILLQKVPNGRVVITQDNDWCSVINEDDKIFPNPFEIANRVLATYHISEEGDVVFLEPKEELQPGLDLHQFSSSQLINLRGHVGLLRRSPSSISSASSGSLGSFFTTTSASTAISSLSSTSHFSPFPSSMNLPALAELGSEQPLSQMMKTTKRGRPFLKDTFGLFATLMVSLQLGPHKQFFRIFPHSFSTDEAAQNLASLKFTQSKREPDPSQPSRFLTTTTTTTFSMTRDMAKALSQHFMDARLIENSLDPSSVLFRDHGTYQLTPKGLHVVENFISKNNINANHLQPVFSSQPICSKLLHLKRRSSDDELIITQSVITALFRRFAGRAPNYPPSADNPLDVFQTYDERSKGIALRDLTERPQPGLDDGKSAVVHRYCFPAIAALNWLCDFTSVVGREEAAEMGAQFVRFGLITLVSDKRRKNEPGLIFTVQGRASGDNFASSQRGEFRCTATAIYKITDEGCRLSQWNDSTPGQFGDAADASIATSVKGQPPADGLLDKEDTATSVIPHRVVPPAQNLISKHDPHGKSSEDSNIGYLQSILRDPGLQSLFRNFLKANSCEENLSFWLDVQDLKKKFRSPMTVVAVSTNLENSSTPGQALMERFAESLINTAILIYNTYLAPSSQCELNIDDESCNELAKYLEKVITSTDVTDKVFQGFIEPQQASAFDFAHLRIMVPMYERIETHVFHSMATNYVPKFIETSQYLAMHAQVGGSEPTEDGIDLFSQDGGPPNEPSDGSEEVGGVYVTISQRASKRAQQAAIVAANPTS